MNRQRLIAGLVATALTVAVGCGGDDSGDSGGGGDVIRIGYSADQSGVYAAYDVPFLNGLEFAADQINESGGPYQVEIVARDNKGDPKLTVSQTQELLDDGILINAIGTGDGRSAAASLISEQGGVALAMGNTYPTFDDEAGGRAASLVITDNINGAATAQYACDQGYRSVFTLGSDDFAYTKFLPVYFEDAFAHYCDGEVIGSASYDIGATDFAPQITQLRSLSEQPDALYTGMFVPDSIAFVKQLEQAGNEIPLLSADANYLNEFIESGGDATDGVEISAYVTPEYPPVEEFQAAYKETTGKAVATQYEAIGRDQVYGVVEAAKLADSTDPTAILDELGNLPEGTLIATRGPIDPETHRPETATMTQVAVENGEFVPGIDITPDYVPEPVR